MKLSLQLGKFRFDLGAKKAANSPIQAWLRGEDSLPANETSALVAPFQQSVWVYTVVSALAQTVSSIPFRISRGERSGESIVTNGPVVDLFNRPHPYMNRFRFWEFIVTWYCLRGEAFIVALDKSGAVLPIKSPRLRVSASPLSSLLVLNPDQFRHVVEGFDLVGWKFSPSPLSGPLAPLNLAPDEVIHDALPNPYLFWRGMSPLSVAMLAAQTDYASAQFMKGLMLNNADTGVVVRTDQQLSPEQREQVMAALRARKRSAGTADYPLLLWGGAEVIQPSLSSADMQFMDNRKMNRQEICAAFFRIPQTLVGFTENANRAVAEAERLNFIENSIMPLCARLEAAIDPIVKSFGPDFIPLRWENGSQEKGYRRKYVEQELVEVSAVSIPANPNALGLALKTGAVERSDVRELFALLKHICAEEETPRDRLPSADAGPLLQLLKQLNEIRLLVNRA